MTKLCIALALLLAQPAWAGTAKAPKLPVRILAKSKHAEIKAGRPAKALPCKTPSTAKPPAPAPANEVAKPDATDPDRARIARLHEALDGIVHGKVLGRLRVGMRVEELASGHVLYGLRSSALMDPASNQKVLGTSAALLRLGSDYR
jgi:hypothetical protein